MLSNQRTCRVLEVMNKAENEPAAEISFASDREAESEARVLLFVNGPTESGGEVDYLCTRLVAIKRRDSV